MPQDTTYNNRRGGKPEHVSKFDHGGRMPPRDNDLEEAVLGALMLEKDAYTVVCDILKPESFYDPEISNNLKRNGGFIPGFRPG